MCLCIKRNSRNVSSSLCCFCWIDNFFPGVEEEKKTDEDQDIARVPQPPAKQVAPSPSNVNDKKKEDSPPPSVGLAGQSCRFLFLDLPLLVLLTLYAGMQLVEYAKEEFFSAQYGGLMWDVARQKDEIT